jgi:hypothetical protein
VSLSNMRRDKQYAFRYEKVASVINCDYSEKICLLETDSHFNAPSSSKFSSQTQTFPDMPNKECSHNVKYINPIILYCSIVLHFSLSLLQSHMQH